MSQRIEQVASEIERGVREVFSRGFQDPRIGGLITITGVKLAHDLKHATVLVSVLPAEKGSLTLHALSDAARHIRREVGERVRIRTMPELVFRLDESLKKQAQVLAALDMAKRESSDSDQRTPSPTWGQRERQEPSASGPRPAEDQGA